MCLILFYPQFPLTAILKTVKNSIRRAQLHCCTSCVLACHNAVTAYKKITVFFLKFCHLTDEGIDTKRILGTTVCSRSVKCEIWQVCFAGCRLKFNYNWKTAGT